jgi:cytochrome c-type biogenesis protein CcmH/NrfG
MLPVFITLLMTAVIAALTFPFWRKRQSLALATAASLPEAVESIDLAIEKEVLLWTLAELQSDTAIGRVTGEDAARLQDETERKLASVLTGLDRFVSVKAGTDLPPSTVPRGRWFALTAGIGIIVLFGSTGLYALVQYKLERGQRMQAAEAGGEIGQPKVSADNPDGAPAMPGINPAEMVARLEKRLAENPDDLQGQMMAGRSYMAMERWEDAKKAWRKAVELDPRNDVAHYNLAEVLIRTSPADDRAASEEALEHIDKALLNQPQEPTFLWARGIVLIQMGRRTEAEEAWVAAYQAIPPNTTASERIKEALEALRSGS